MYGGWRSTPSPAMNCVCVLGVSGDLTITHTIACIKRMVLKSCPVQVLMCSVTVHTHIVYVNMAYKWPKCSLMSHPKVKPKGATRG